MNWRSLFFLGLLWLGGAVSPGRAGVFTEALARFRHAEETGFSWQAGETFPEAYRSSHGASDEGPFGLPLMGGIGTGGLGRDLHGHFDRWHFQPGFPRQITVDAASLCVRWEQGERSGAWRLGEAGWDRPLPPGVKRTAVLWPVVAEALQSPDWPVEVVVESWSPVVPHDYHASALPVVFFDVYARNPSNEVAKLDLALFMPNFLGWRRGAGTVMPGLEEKQRSLAASQRMGPRVWPDRSHSGNRASLVDGAEAGGLRGGVLMRGAEGSPPVRDMQGEILLAVGGDAAVRMGRLAACLANGNPANAPGAPAAAYQIGAETAFFQSGVLPEGVTPWQATATEAQTGAVSGGLTLEPGGEGHFTLVMGWDLPLVQFGSGRAWKKAATATYGAEGNQAVRIAREALASRAKWRAELEAWHRKYTNDGALEVRRRGGAAINDLYFVVAGGTAWVAGEAVQPGLEPPALGSGEHFSMLEGFDTGYYFTSTADLWPHAQPALSAHWPRLAGLMLDDFMKSAPLVDNQPRFITSLGRTTPVKVPNKIPHDLGCPPGDPWHRLNEYNTGRDSNGWKDHNPAFILSLYLHRKHTGGKAPDEMEWRTLLALTDFMIRQDKNRQGLPWHDTQGDNTWDALHFTGPSPYSGGLTLGAWAAMAEWSRQRGDGVAAGRFEGLLALGQASFQKHFWNGNYYRSAADGEQAEWVLADALFGILLAECAGLKGLLPPAQVRAHLEKVAARNWQDFRSGTVGPCLLAPESGPIPSGAVQVGEVITGSARSTIALMQRSGLAAPGDAMADAVNRTLYGGSGLQFRTPAAWSAAGKFRAPNNMRPLASWYSFWPERR